MKTLLFFLHLTKVCQDSRRDPVVFLIEDGFKSDDEDEERRILTGTKVMPLSVWTNRFFQ